MTLDELIAERRHGSERMRKVVGRKIRPNFTQDSSRLAALGIQVVWESELLVWPRSAARS
jgi:hypothetical protein